MATRPTPTVETSDWQTISEPNDWQDTTRESVPALMPSHEPIDYSKLSTALVTSHMTKMPASLAYQNHDQVQSELAKHDAQVVPSTIANDIKVGGESSIFGLAYRNKLPDALQKPGMFDKFVSGVSELIADLPVYVAGSLLGAAAGSEVPGVGNVAGGAMGTFAVPAALRESFMLAIEKGDIKSFRDLMERTLQTTYAGAKGAVVGRLFGLAGAGTVPLGKMLGPAAPVAETVAKSAQQAAAVEVATSLLDGHMPTAEGIGKNAILVTALNLLAHGIPMDNARSRQAAMDIYAKDGTTPEETATKLQAQPPNKPDAPAGLQPAIKLTAKDGSEQVITGEHDTHSDLAEATTGERPVTVEELEADPKLADKVLSQPATHVQQVIDRAYTMKADADPAFKQPKPKSGRGFTTDSGDYLSRNQAKSWVKANEPDVYEQWVKGQDGNEKAEFHSADYKEARERAAALRTAEGEPQLNGVSGELTSFLAKNREELNKVKASDEGSSYGNTVIRSTYVGPRNMVKATGEQIASHLDKLLPDSLERDAMSFMRDYRDVPEQLQDMIERTRNGDNEELKRAIPAMELALNPTPKMLEADKLFTEGFTQANNLRTTFTNATSSIDPERYSPRNFMRVESEESKGVGTPKFSKRSPHDIRRQYEHLLDPLESGDIKSRTFDAVDQFRVYYDRLANSVATSVFQMELKNTELGKHGVAGQVPPELKAQLADTGIMSSKELEELGGIPKDWVELPGTGKTIVSDGKQVHVGLQVPPRIAEAMKPLLEKDAISGAKYWKAAKMSQAYIKALELGLSPFHMRALSISFMNNAGIDAYRNALASDNNSSEFEAQERKGALYGLTTTKTGTPYEAYKGLKPSSVESRNTLLSKVKQGYEPVDKLFKGVTKATFDVVQRKFKVIDFSTREAQWLAKHPDATDAEYGTAMRSIAKEVNAVYGGLNWDVMGVSANFQAVARMFLLAPDWTFSNVANLKYAAEGGPGGSAARSCPVTALGHHGSHA
jgi:hypothetical protein